MIYMIFYPITGTQLCINDEKRFHPIIDQVEAIKDTKKLSIQHMSTLTPSTFSDFYFPSTTKEGMG